MEKKNFNRGTMVGGIVRIVIALIAVLIAINVISSGIKSYDPEDKFGTIFMCLIGGIMIIAAIGFIGNGAKMRSRPVLGRETRHCCGGKRLDR